MPKHSKLLVFVIKLSDISKRAVLCPHYWVSLKQDIPTLLWMFSILWNWSHIKKKKHHSRERKEMQVITRRQCAKNDVKCDLFQCDLFMIFDLTPSLSHILIPHGEVVEPYRQWAGNSLLQGHTQRLGELSPSPVRPCRAGLYYIYTLYTYLNVSNVIYFPKYQSQ